MWTKKRSKCFPKFIHICVCVCVCIWAHTYLHTCTYTHTYCNRWYNCITLNMCFNLLKINCTSNMAELQWRITYLQISMCTGSRIRGLLTKLRSVYSISSLGINTIMSTQRCTIWCYVMRVTLAEDFGNLSEYQLLSNMYILWYQNSHHL